MEQKTLNRTSWQAIVFDFDDVLIDSTAAHVDAWQHAHQALFGKALSGAQRLLGMSGSDIGKLLAAENGTPHLWDDLYQKKTQLVLQRAGAIAVMQGAQEIFTRLKSRGIPFGIATNARRTFVDEVFAKHSFLLEAQAVVTFNDVQRPKPHPEVFLQCAQLLGFHPEIVDKVLVIEDSPVGIQAANAAGMQVLGVCSCLADQHLLQAGAAKTIATLADLLAWL